MKHIKVHTPNKLVRDNIPDIIINKGGDIKCLFLTNNDDFKKSLINKMREEIAEFENDSNIEEIADIYEVFMTLVSVSGFCMNEVINVVNEKKNKNGGFDKRIFLQEYTEIINGDE